MLPLQTDKYFNNKMSANDQEIKDVCHFTLQVPRDVSDERTSPSLEQTSSQTSSTFYFN